MYDEDSDENSTLKQRKRYINDLLKDRVAMMKLEEATKIIDNIKQRYTYSIKNE
jgi:hypothetical protein